MSNSNTHRRRGDDLLNDIYAVSYQILTNEQFSDLSFSAVAKRAHTSRSVLYRYWDDPFELAVATIHHYIPNAAEASTELNFDNGSLRADLIFVGNHFANWMQAIPPEFNRMVISEMSRNEITVSKLLKSANQLSQKLIGHVLTLAADRDEIRINTKIPLATQLVLFQLIRYQLVMVNQPVTAANITNWVDTIVLPAILQLAN